MIIKYDIVITLFNKITNTTSTLPPKTFTNDINVPDSLLYNNYHILSSGQHIFLDMFKDESKAYCDSNNISINDIEIDEFEVTSCTANVNVFLASLASNPFITYAGDNYVEVFDTDNPLN